MWTLKLKDGTEKKGYWNQKRYNGIIYFNVSDDGTKKGINFKKSEKYEISNIKSCTYDNIITTSMPKTTAGWMAEMARSER